MNANSEKRSIRKAGTQEKTSIHPEDICERCGRKNITWFTDNELWNNIARNKGWNILCPFCFVAIAEKLMNVTAWKIIPE